MSVTHIARNDVRPGLWLPNFKAPRPPVGGSFRAPSPERCTPDGSCPELRAVRADLATRPSGLVFPLASHESLALKTEQGHPLQVNLKDWTVLPRWALQNPRKGPATQWGPQLGLNADAQMGPIPIPSQEGAPLDWESQSIRGTVRMEATQTEWRGSFLALDKVS